MSTEELEAKLFPKEEWNAQRNHLNGDNTNVGRKFVSANAPFGSCAVAQDGEALLNILI